MRMRRAGPHEVVTTHQHASRALGVGKPWEKLGKPGKTMENRGKLIGGSRFYMIFKGLMLGLHFA